MSLVGYARVATAEGRQILDRQLDALNAAGCERAFEDRASGAAPDRPNLAACLDYLRTAATSWSSSTSTGSAAAPAGRAFLQIQAAFAEMERNVIRQRVCEGEKEHAHAS